jgi:hypothetical protein
MHIKKTAVEWKYRIGWFESDYEPIYEYTVVYRGFVAADPDLGAAISKCYAAAA